MARANQDSTTAVVDQPTKADQEQEIQQEPLSPDTKARAEHNRNPFVLAGTPTKVSSFKDISKQSLLAHLQTAVVFNPPKASKLGQMATKFRSPLTSMLIRRSKPEPQPAEAAVTAFNANASDKAAQKQIDASAQPKVTSQSQTKKVLPSTEEKKLQQQVNDTPEPTSSPQPVTNEDKPEPEPEQAQQDDSVTKVTAQKEAEQETKGSKGEETKQDSQMTKESQVTATIESTSEFVKNDSQNGQKMPKLRTAAELSTDKASTVQKQDDTVSPEAADIGVAKSPRKSNMTGAGRQRRNKKQTRFSVPMAMPLPSDKNDSDGAQQPVAAFQNNNSNTNNRNKSDATQNSYTQGNRREGRDTNRGGKHSTNGNSRKQFNNRDSTGASSKPARGSNGADETTGRHSEPAGYTGGNTRGRGAEEHGQSGSRRSDATGRGGDRSNTEGGRYYNNGNQPSRGGANNKDQMSYIKYKTSLCRHFEEFQTCSLGDACSFAHGETEKRGMNDPMPTDYPGRHYVGAVHSNYKTQVCRNYEQTGMCKFMENCCFAHGDDQLRNLTDPLPPIPREVLLYCPPNMKLLPSHGNIQIIQPNSNKANGQVDFNQNMGVYFDGQQPDQCYPMGQDDQQQFYGQMQASPYYQNNGFGQEQYMQFGVNGGATSPMNPFGQPFNNFTPPGHDPVARGLQQNTFPMPYPFQPTQMSQQPQDEKPMADHQQQLSQTNGQSA